jgi:regulator of sirC expression with transglutaminase-like and TPR domain
MTHKGDSTLTQDAQTKPKEARMVAVQDEQGFHLCSRFLKEYTPEGHAVFEDDGHILTSYGVYEIAIQDLENCLAFARAMREKTIQEKAAAEDQADKPAKK